MRGSLGLVWQAIYLLATIHRIHSSQVQTNAETHIVDLELALVLFLQVPRQVIENSSAATPVGVEAWGVSDLMHLQTRLLICGGDVNMLSYILQHRKFKGQQNPKIDSKMASLL